MPPTDKLRRIWEDLNGSGRVARDGQKDLAYGVVALLALLGFALYLCLHGGLNADEGFYLMASRLVSRGWRIYRDFGFTQGPVLPYANLPWLELFGFTLAGQRLAGLAWTLIAAGAGAAWLRRHGSWLEAAVFVVLLLGSPVWLAFAVKGKTYAFAGLTVLAGAVALLAAWPSWMRWAIFLVAAALGVGARYPMAGFFMPAWICLLVSSPGWRIKTAMVLLTVASAMGFTFFAAGGEWARFFYWTMNFHTRSTFSISVVSHYWDGFRFFPALWLFALLAFAVSIKRRETAVLMVAGALLVALILNLSARSTYAEYIFPFVPTAALIVAPTLANLLARVSRPTALMILGLTLGLGWNYPPELSPNILLHAGQAEAFLREHLPPDAVVAASMPEIPAASGHQIPLLMAMGKFSLTEDESPSVAKELGMLSPETLERTLKDPATKALVFSSSYNWNFFWSLPSYRPLSNAAKNELRETLKTQYQLAFANQEYAIFLRRPFLTAPADPNQRRHVSLTFDKNK